MVRRRGLLAWSPTQRLNPDQNITHPAHTEYTAVPAQNRPVMWALFQPLARTVRAYSAGMKSGPSFALCLSTAALVLAPLSWAQSPSNAPSPSPDGALEQMARDFLQPALGQSIGAEAGVKLRPEVVMGQLDSRLRLAPCGAIEPYLPPGTRLWGRSKVGLRCVDGISRWNVFVPVTVKAWGPAWVMKSNVPAGETLSADHAEQTEVDWAAHPSPVLATTQRWIGHQAAYPLQAGQPLRENMVRAPQAFEAGAQVKVSSGGAGFSISVVGQAVAAARVGEPARVRLPNGRVVTGTVRPDQTVSLDL